MLLNGRYVDILTRGTPIRHGKGTSAWRWKHWVTHSLAHIPENINRKHKCLYYKNHIDMFLHYVFAVAFAGTNLSKQGEIFRA